MNGHTPVGNEEGDAAVIHKGELYVMSLETAERWAGRITDRICYWDGSAWIEYERG